MENKALQTVIQTIVTLTENIVVSCNNGTLPEQGEENVRKKT